MLRVFAMLVSNVASTLRMRLRRPVVNATRQMPQPLPRETSDTIKEPIAVQPDSPKALMLSSTQSVRPSKHEGVLTNASHKPAQPEHPIHLAPPPLRSSRRKSGLRASRVMLATGLLMQPWIPAFAGTSGTKPAIAAPL